MIHLLKRFKFNYTQTSYAQAGEDAILRYLFRDIGMDRITYLDLGTNYPYRGNNTYWFYRNGSRGVCVEPDPDLVRWIRKVRPKDAVIHAGVAVSVEKEADFYVFNEPAMNTFSKALAEERSKSGKYKMEKIIKVPLLHINELIKDHFPTFPDLLSIDIEGFDLEVLKSLDLVKYPIPVICVETCTYSEDHIRPKDRSVAGFLHTAGYETYADTYVNTIFVNKNWFYKG